MNFNSQIKGLNEFLAAVYGAETRISTLLTSIGFEPYQIDLLRDHHLEPVVSNFVTTIKEYLIADERLYQIISRRFGLDGEPPETLQIIGESLGISHEQVHQLENEAIRKCKSEACLQFFATKLHSIASSQLGVAAGHAVVGRIVSKLDRLAEVQAAADVLQVDYEAKRAEIMKPVQAELDALEAEYESLLKTSADRIVQLEAEIKNEVLLHGATVQSGKFRAVYMHGRVSWDTKAIMQYAVSHPEVLKFRNQGKPGVSLRVAKQGRT